MVHIRRIDESEHTDLAGYFSQEYPEIAIDRGDREWNEYREKVNNRLTRLKNTRPDIYKTSGIEDVGTPCKRAKVSISEDLLVWLANMTSANYHDDARYEIARYLSGFSEDMKQFEIYYRSFIDAFRKGGKAYPKDWKPNRVMEEMMFITIARIFGMDVVRKFYACL